MQGFFLEYRDPIFGLIIFVSTILMIAILSYIWGLFSAKEQKDSIERFIKKFNSNKELDSRYIKILEESDLECGAYEILASMFSRSGEFTKAIDIYLVALEKIKEKNDKIFILNSLAKVYFRAGFLKKSSEIFLESIKLDHKNGDALKMLGVIYEKLKLYDKELEVLDALMEQNYNVQNAISYAKINMIIDDATLTFDEKIKRLLEEKEFKFLGRVILELFIKNKEPLSNVPLFPKPQDALDIIWYLDERINLKDSKYKALFDAKDGKETRSDIFEINALAAMKKSGFEEASLSFKFICLECKNSFPLFFYRCPVCYSLESAKIITSLVKNSEEDIPFL